MNTFSISQLKMKPAEAIREASDYPVAIRNHDKVQAYLIGKDLYEKLVAFVENLSDRRAVAGTDFGKGRDFEKVARELGI